MPIWERLLVRIEVWAFAAPTLSCKRHVVIDSQSMEPVLYRMPLRIKSSIRSWLRRFFIKYGVRNWLMWRAVRRCRYTPTPEQQARINKYFRKREVLTPEQVAKLDEDL